MVQQTKIACVFGANGLLGSAIVAKLIEAGYHVRACARRKESVYFLRPLAEPSQITPVQFDANNNASIDAAIGGASVVINAVGTTKKRELVEINASLPAAIAKAARGRGAKHLIHVSCINSPCPKSYLAQTISWGNAAVKSWFANANILQTSAIFGAKGDFIDNLSKFLFLPAKGCFKLQPVYVQDVASACVKAIGSVSQTYFIGGGEVFTLREITDKISKITGQRISKICPIARIFPKVFQRFKQDSIVPNGAIGLKDLGITPTPIDEILPRYIGKNAKPVF